MVRAVPADDADHRSACRRVPWQSQIGKLNVDDNGQTAMRYQVRGIPTLLLFKGGQLVATKVGATGKSDVQKMLDEHVA